MKEFQLGGGRWAGEEKYISSSFNLELLFMQLLNPNGKRCHIYGFENAVFQAPDLHTNKSRSFDNDPDEDRCRPRGGGAGENVIQFVESRFGYSETNATRLSSY